MSKPDETTEALKTLAVVVVFCAALLVVYVLGGPIP